MDMRLREPRFESESAPERLDHDERPEEEHVNVLHLASSEYSKFQSLARFSLKRLLPPHPVRKKKGGVDRAVLSQDLVGWHFPRFDYITVNPAVAPRGPSFHHDPQVTGAARTRRIGR